MRRGCLAVCVLLVSGAVVSAAEYPYCADPDQQGASRCSVLLSRETEERDGRRGDGRGESHIVYVDNASSMVNAHIAELVIIADRSTQDGSPQSPPNRKGLIHSKDRVCVTDRYIAWFDYSMQDGVRFDAPYGNASSRAGTLAGLWTLNPSTQWFRYPRPSPDGSGGSWAHNEIIPGSASPDGGQFWWDQHAPPLEHTFLVPVGADVPKERHGGWGWFFVSYHFAQASTASGWTVTDDGRRSAEGVHYRTTTRMASWRGQVDMVDGEDQQDIKNSIRASMEYICRPDDIVARWRFSPEKADVSTTNMYVGLWLAYAGDNDGHERCDPAPGEQWPNQTWGQPLYIRSSESIGFFGGPGNSYDVRAGAVGRLTLHEPACDHRSDGSQHWDYYNTGAYTNTSRVRAGAWIEAGESSDFAVTTPVIRITVSGEPGTGAGTQDDPYSMAWKNLNVWHENVDSTIGMGTGSQSGTTVLKAGLWYESVIMIRTSQ